MKFEFYYPHSNITQVKKMISHEDYLQFKVLPDDSKKIEKKKKQLEKFISGGEEWFTDKSPLAEAIQTGILDCNGKYSVNIKSLNYEV